MPKPHKFWDRIAKFYSRQPVPDEGIYQQKLAKTRAHLTPDTEMFEFGAGTGSTAIAHAPHVKHVETIDISPKMVAIAREKAEAAGLTNVDFKVGGIDDYDAGGRTFDVVLGMSILHLVKDHDAVILRVHELLKPGGIFVSSTTCMGDRFGIFRYLGPIGYALGLLPLLNIFSRKELEASIARAGFEMEEVWQPTEKSAVFIIARKPA